MHFKVDEPEFSEQVRLSVMVSFLAQPSRENPGDSTEPLASAPLRLYESVVKIEDDPANLPNGQSLSIPDICFWPAIGEPLSTQSSVKLEINVFDDYSLSPLFEHVHPRVRYLHLRVFLETDNHAVPGE